LNPNFAIELPACSAVRQNSHEVPPVAGLTPLTPKRCVAARRADFSNEKSGLKKRIELSNVIKEARRAVLAVKDKIPKVSAINE